MYITYDIVNMSVIFYDYLDSTFVNSHCEADVYCGVDVVKARIDPKEYKQYLDASYEGNHSVMTMMEYIEGGLHLSCYNEKEDTTFQLNTFTEDAKIISEFLFKSNLYK